MAAQAEARATPGLAGLEPERAQIAPEVSRSPGAIARVLALQGCVGNAALCGLLGPEGDQPGRETSGALLRAVPRLPRPRRPAVIAREAAPGRCPCGGVIPPGQDECDDCRRKREGGESEVARALARAVVDRRSLQRKDVCDEQGICHSEPDEPASRQPVPSAEPNQCGPGPGQVGPGARAKARPVGSMIKPDAVYALAVTPGLVATGYQVPQGLLAAEGLQTAEGLAVARGLVAARALPVAAEAVVEGVTLAESLAAAGETLLVIEAAGGAEAEAVVGPIGWIVGAVVLVTAGGLLLTAYLLSDKPKTPTPQPQPAPGPAAGTATDPLVCGPAPNASAAPATQPEVRKYPGQLCSNARLEELHSAMKAICDSGISCSDAAEREGMGATTRKQYDKMIAAGKGWPCPEILQRLAATEACHKARQQIQSECFGNAPEPGHDRQLESARQAVETCRAKAKARGC